METAALEWAGCGKAAFPSLRGRPHSSLPAGSSSIHTRCFLTHIPLPTAPPHTGSTRHSGAQSRQTSLRSNRTATGTSHPGAESTTAAQHSRPTPTTATHVRTRCLGRRAGAVSNFYFLVATLPFYLHLFSKHSVSCFWNQKTNIILKFRCKRLLVWERSPSRRLLKQKSRYASVMQSEKQKTNQDIM